MRIGARQLTIRSAALAGASVLTVLAVVATSHQGASAQAPSSSIMLDVDSPDTGANVANGQRFFIGGWAAAAGSTQGSGISSVDVYLDSPQGSNNRIGSARLGVARPDVARTFNQPQWGSSGYNFDWVPRNVSEGPHTIYVVAHSSSGDSTTQTVQVNGCACGFVGSITNPGVTRIGTQGNELDTGGPGTFFERTYDSPRGN